MATRRRNNTKHHKMSKKEQKLWKKILFWLFIGWWFYLFKFLFWDIPKWIIKAVKNKKQDNSMVDINSYSGQTPNKRKMSLTEIIVIVAGSAFGLFMLIGVIAVISTPKVTETFNDESSIATSSTFENSVDNSIEESNSEPSVTESSVEESKVEIPVVESSVQPAPEPTLQTFTFILNTGSHKYHLYECAAVKNMSADKRLDITKSAYSLDEAKRMVEADGYTLCGNCAR